MSLKSEHSSTSFLGKLDAQLVLGKRGRKRSDKKALQKEEAAKKKKVINPDDLIKPEDLPNGLLCIPYGPPTTHLMSSETFGSGMPVSKHMEVAIEKIVA